MFHTMFMNVALCTFYENALMLCNIHITSRITIYMSKTRVYGKISSYTCLQIEFYVKHITFLADSDDITLHERQLPPFFPILIVILLLSLIGFQFVR